MDITILFKACVKTVRTTNKALGVKESKSDIFKETRKDAYLTKAKDIVKQISTLKKVLDENKSAYLNVLNYLSTNKTMTEVDREQIDTAAEKIIGACSSMLNNLKTEVHAMKRGNEVKEHYLYVVESVEKYLKNISKIYAEAKALRVKRVIETHKLSKLETSQDYLEPKPLVGEKISKSDLEKTDRQNSPKSKYTIPPQTPPTENIENELSTEEMQMFESENDLLYNELNSLSDEVKQIESKVVHIAELQELFTEKVLEQDRDIERIATAVVTSTDNMKDANEQIKQAIQRNAGLRVWILFFLLVMSFSLLFLDWYND